MQKYFYDKDFMFYMGNYDDKDLKFKERITEYMKNDYEIMVEFKNKESLIIDFKSKKYDLKVSAKFIFNDELFNNCYRFYKYYESSSYKGSKPLINNLYKFLYKYYSIVTKKEPLYCSDCGKQIGLIYNDFDDDDNSICAFGGHNQDQKEMYEYYELFHCENCGEYYCDECANFDYEDTFICDSCNETYVDDYDILDSNWVSCKLDEDDARYEECEDCEYREECISDAEDNRDGYASFCDIVTDAYGSVDAFWECNGI